MSSVNQQLSLYIPHVFANVTDRRISEAFVNNDYGVVSSVDKVSKVDKTGHKYNSVYIHFSKWNDTETVRRFQERVISDEHEARVVYDDPWFWIVLENKGEKHISGDRRKTIDISSKSEFPTISKTDLIKKVLKIAPIVPAPAPAHVEPVLEQFNHEQFNLEHLALEQYNQEQEQLQLQYLRQQQIYEQNCYYTPMAIPMQFYIPAHQQQYYEQPTQPSYNLVSCDYAEILERKITQLMEENKMLREQYDIDEDEHSDFIDELNNREYYMQSQQY